MKGRFEIRATPLEGAVLLERKILGDARGFFERLFCTDELMEAFGNRSIVQINRSRTMCRGCVRGMHFQRPPHAECKIVTCLRGEVFDVAVDLRKNSPTYLSWHAEVLSESNHRSFLIPEGFAHGFQTLSESCEMLYFHSAPFVPEAEGGIHPGDPALSIAWPEEITEISPRDSLHPLIGSETDPMLS
jgi:dTDP-4-dehydrorhamnose 3,5-epimerase